MPLTPVLTSRWGADQSWRLATYERLEGYTALKTALRMQPDELVTMVKDSGLRGRGGAGFPTGMKWSFIPQPKPGETPTGPAAMPKYLVVNADEGEPGTCKDLPLMMVDPHSLIEGVIISAFAIRSHFAVIYVRGEAVHAHRRLVAAVEEAYAAGYLGTDILGSGYDLELVVHAGAGAYICGEETALLDSLEGYRGQPRLKPPFPAVAGLYGAPTVINNVETLASVPFVVRGGADWFKDFGPEKSPGPKIYSLSGRVVRPGQYEAPMGTTMRELLEMAGGIRPGPRAEVLDAGRLVDAVLHRRAPRRPAGLRLGRGGGLDARHHRADGVRRDRLDRRGDPAVHRVLRPRELRQVHPVPRGHLLAGADPRADRARPRHRAGPRHPARHLRQHPGPLVLRPR